jgi:pyrrolidone-carboxylate peptidase
VPNNPSWGIASRLPSSLPNDIQVVVHPQFVPVAYHPVIDLVPDLIADYQPDIALHIGVAEGRTYFAVEQTSQKRGYEWGTDVDGEVFTVEEQDALWGDQPATLSTDLDLETIVDVWQNRTADFSWPDLGQKRAARAGSTVEVKMVEDVMNVDDVEWSDAVGTYLCGFIYYTSMVESSRNGKNQARDVAFMHVPMLDTDEEIELGVNVTIELIQSLVQTWREDQAQ